MFLFLKKKNQFVTFLYVEPVLNAILIIGRHLPQIVNLLRNNFVVAFAKQAQAGLNYGMRHFMHNNEIISVCWYQLETEMFPLNRCAQVGH